MTDSALLPPPPRRPADFADDFSAPPEPGRWIAHYLPQWTTPDRSQARWALVGDGLQLRIEADQPDWRPEDAPLRVSNLQTGTFSGPVGSSRGTHRHRPDGLEVRSATGTRLLWAPAAGRVDVTVSATRDPGCMLAAWLVGTEHRSERESGELCLFEIDADTIEPDRALARCGLKAHHDPGLRTDMAEVEVPIDVTRPHTWTLIWGGGEALIGCEGRVVRRLGQAPAYPLFLLVDLFEIGGPRGRYPKAATVRQVLGWSSAADAE